MQRMSRKRVPRVPLAAVAAALMLAILPAPATAIIIPSFDDMFGYVTDAESGAVQTDMIDALAMP